MKIPNDTQVLIADGRKSLLLRNQGTPFEPRFELVERREIDNPAAREQGADAPGRTFSSVGTHRSALEAADLHQLEEDRFAADLAGELRQRLADSDDQGLIVVAPPRTLGTLRGHYDPMVRARLLGEVAKDLTGHPIPDIEAALAG